MKDLEERLIALSLDKGYLTSYDITDVSNDFEITYEEVLSFVKNLNIDFISQNEVIRDIKEIETDDKMNPLLTKEEVILLFKRIETLKSEISDLDESNNDDLRLIKKYKKEIDTIKLRIIDSHIPLVYFIAKKFITRNLQLEDLLSEGKIGIIKAIDQYDYKLNIKFTTFAYYKIFSEINRAIQNYDRSIRVPVCVITQYYKIIRTRDLLANKLGKIPSNEELAKEMNISVLKVNNALKYNTKILSLDNKIDEDEKISLQDMIHDTNLISPEQASINDYIYKEIISALNKIEPKNKEIFIMRYGLLDDKPASLEVIGDKFGLSKERIRQILNKTTKQLRILLSHLKDIAGGLDEK